MDFGSLNIEEILGSMSNEDMEMLSAAAQSIFSSVQPQQEKKKESKPPQNDSNPFSSFNIDLETIGKIMSFMERLNNRPKDPRCDLLLSLRPMLSEKKQGKIDDAIKLLSLLSLLPLIEEMGGNGNG